MICKSLKWTLHYQINLIQFIRFGRSDCVKEENLVFFCLIAFVESEFLKVGPGQIFGLI